LFICTSSRLIVAVRSVYQSLGTPDLLIAVVDGLKGFPDAITSIFPDCVVQTCIVHLIRYSMQFASWKERKALAKALKPIYAAASADAAAAELDAFEEGLWGEKYPAVTASWRRRWEEVIPFFAFSPEAVRSPTPPMPSSRCTARSERRSATKATLRATSRRRSWCTWP
jgi:transposase-like protein